MTNWADLVSDDELKRVFNDRKKEFDRETISKEYVGTKENEGWSIVKQYKNGNALMERKKRVGDAFEDEVWSIFYKMGFKVMNASRHFNVSYSDDNPDLTQQVDVIAIDDEVCLFIECKASETMNKTKAWKTTLESIDGYKGKLFREIRKNYPDRKFKYIFATRNYVIGDKDKDRLNSFKIANFEYETIRYYSQLVDHIGAAAKYQLLANLFVNEEIKGMDNKVPAIKGKMGGVEYYSFSIEPEKLLKIAYVLHRTHANHDLMPTYQRIIKKDRLKAVREYINNKNFFPNSLILSIDTRGKSLVFDRSSLQVEGSISKIGVLHLPKQYQSAYIIDGQHRLYGYSDSDYAESSTIPVVAFVDLEKNQQLKMFMDINENQKQVSKSLRHTLNIDLLWDSEKYHERNMALMLYLGQKLGEEAKSPLYGRVITGENSITTDRCITLEYIRDALDKTKFFNEYNKKNNEILKHGTLAKSTNELTRDNILPLLIQYFSDIESYCSNDWVMGSEGFLTINNTIYALIRILDDIFNLALKRTGKTTVLNWEEIYPECEKHILGLCETLLSLNDETKAKIKKAKGGAAKTEAWRTLQVALHNKDNTFINDDLKAYIENNCIDYKDDVLERLNYSIKTLKNIVKDELETDESWFERLLPEELSLDLVQRLAGEAFKRKISQDKISVWEIITLKDIKLMINYGNNWSNKLQKYFNNDEKNIKYTKKDIISEVENLIRLENKLSNGARYTKSDYDKIYIFANIFEK